MGNAAPLNTLDEPIWHRVKRDLKRIGANLVLVVFPFSSRDQQSAALRNWDLWGPMVCHCSFVLLHTLTHRNQRLSGWSAF